MTLLTKEELIEIRGGANFSGSLIAAIVKGINVILSLGRSLGSSVRRICSNNICPL